MYRVKKGSDKNRVTAREELQRMFQEAALVHADEIPVPGTSVADIDREFFESFFEQFVGEPLVEQEISLVQLMENMNLMRAGQLNLSGALLFAKNRNFVCRCLLLKQWHFLGRILQTRLISIAKILRASCPIFSKNH
jgi:Predicted transcriptional regulator containing an HTH domain and an uncharacterized domain shared with the mammalian protein Schlafen